MDTHAVVLQDETVDSQRPGLCFIIGPLDRAASIIKQAGFRQCSRQGIELHLPLGNSAIDIAVLCAIMADHAGGNIRYKVVVIRSAQVAGHAGIDGHVVVSGSRTGDCAAAVTEQHVSLVAQVGVEAGGNRILAGNGSATGFLGGEIGHMRRAWWQLALRLPLPLSNVWSLMTMATGETVRREKTSAV